MPVGCATLSGSPQVSLHSPGERRVYDEGMVLAQKTPLYLPPPPTHTLTGPLHISVVCQHFISPFFQFAAVFRILHEYVREASGCCGRSDNTCAREVALFHTAGGGGVNV